MLSKPALLSFGNMGLRGLGLVARLGLTIYLVRYLSLEDVGAFGLVAGVVGMAPAILGWGLNYFMSREVVDAPIPQAMQLIRDRLAVTVATVGVSGALVIGGLLAAGVPPPPYALPTLCLVVLECIAFDVQMSLIALRMSFVANLLLFVRSASWVFPAAMVGIGLPQFRSLEFMLWCWIAGMAASYLGLAAVVHFKRFPLRLGRPIDSGWIAERLRRGWLIYLNDIGIVGLLYFDRYVVSHFLGLEVAGIFTTYWSVANAVHVLIYTGVMQPSLPQLVSSNKTGTREEWLEQLLRLAKLILLGGGALSVVLFAAVQWGLPQFGVHGLQGHGLLFALMLAGILTRLLADLAHLGMYSIGLDRPLALINILGIGVTLCVSAICTYGFGMLGAGLATLLTPTLLLMLRAYALRRAMPTKAGGH